MSLLKKEIIKTAKFNRNGISTIESEMYQVPNKNSTYVIHRITDEITHVTTEYKFGFSEYDNANSYFNSIIKGWLY